MQNFDEVELNVKVHVVIKRGKEKELVQHILNCFPEYIDIYYANENLQVMVHKIGKEDKNED